MQGNHGLIESAAVAIKNGKIIYAGVGRNCNCVSTTIDGKGRWSRRVNDCHTHLVYGGDRAKNLNKDCKVSATLISLRLVAESEEQ